MSTSLRRFKAEQASGFTRLALTYALPAALFLGMAHFDRELLLQQGPAVIVMLIGYSGLYLLLFWLLRALGVDKLRGAAGLHLLLHCSLNRTGIVP